MDETGNAHLGDKLMVDKENIQVSTGNPCHDYSYDRAILQLHRFKVLSDWR